MFKYYSSTGIVLLIVSLSLAQQTLAETSHKSVPFGITQRNFDCKDHSSRSLVIKKSGTYVLRESISYCPKREKTAAIVIDADNVVLDLQGFELTQGNHVLRTLGIQVLAGHNNITIIGSYGAVRNFSQLGIYVQGNTRNIQLGNDASALFITDCGGKSAQAWGEPGNAFLEGGAQLGETNYWQVSGLTEYHGLIINLTLKNVVIEKNSPVGLYLGSGNDFKIQGSSISYNFNDRVNGVRFFGSDAGTLVATFGLSHLNSPFHGDSDIDGFIIQNTVINGNKADGVNFPEVAQAFCDGFSCEIAKNMLVQNSQFDDNVATGCITSGVRGYAYGAGGCIRIENSQACGNTAGFSAQGFHQSGFLPPALPTDPIEIYRSRTVVYERTISSGNTADFALRGPLSPPVGFAYGHIIAWTDGTSLIDCTVSNNKVLAGDPDPNFVGGAQGLFIAGGDLVGAGPIAHIPVSNVVIRGLHASGNSCDAQEGTGAFVFLNKAILLFDSFTQNIEITDAVLTQNSSDVNNSSAGIVMLGITPGQPAQEVTLNKSSIADHTVGIWGLGYRETNVQNSTLSKHEVGIELIDCDCSAIHDNIFLHNGIAVLDLQDPSTTWVADNKGFDNAGGFVVEYPFGPAPVTTGDLVTEFPPLPTVSGENVETAGSCVQGKKMLQLASAHKKRVTSLNDDWRFYTRALFGLANHS